MYSFETLIHPASQLLLNLGVTGASDQSEIIIDMKWHMQQTLTRGYVRRVRQLY